MVSSKLALNAPHILRHFNALPECTPSDTAIGWFREILGLLAATPPEDTVKDALKRMKALPAYKARISQMKQLAKENGLAATRLTANTDLFFTHFLEGLGFCGVLETATHKSYFSGTVHPFPPRASWSSDWYYPADFWKGKDGLNQTSLEYWFSAYL